MAETNQYEARTFIKSYNVNASNFLTKQAVHKRGNCILGKTSDANRWASELSMQGKHNKRSKIGKQHIVGNDACAARCDPPGLGLKSMKQIVFARDMWYASPRNQKAFW